MKSITFRNFRRFEEFPEFKFGDITILVGGNNAGKSTLLKALILLVDNMKELKSRREDIFDFAKPVFSFDMDHIHQLNLGTLGRALRIGSDGDDGGLQFTANIGNFRITFWAGNRTHDLNSPTAPVDIEIEDLQRGVWFRFDWTGRMYAEFKEKEVDDGEPASTKIYASLSNYIDQILDTDYSMPSNPLALFIYQWVAYYMTKPWLAKLNPPEKEDGKSIPMEVHEFNHDFLAGKIEMIRDIAKELDHTLNRLNNFDEIRYIQAHAITQRVIYSIDNRNDYMASVLHRFSRENILKGTEPDRFLRKWLQEFEIGLDYRINAIQGEGYTLEIETSPNVWQHLADLGMGSNQLITLLAELAILLKVKGLRQHPLIIIEEPEQNLHPKIQSRLAVMFEEINRERGFKFLIETHSEYLIRRTQVMVADMELEEEEMESKNPFKVYYFQPGGQPYDMGYKPNGHFEESFGEGFFDEAGRRTRELLRGR